jgi:hypothetical protein
MRRSQNEMFQSVHRVFQHLDLLLQNLVVCLRRLQQKDE